MFGSKVNFLSHSSTLKFFKNDNLWTPLAPLLGEIQLCVHWVFCRKFNSEQLLYEAFFYIIRIFCNVLPKRNALFANLNPCKNYSNSLLDHSDVVITHRATLFNPLFFACVWFASYQLPVNHHEITCFFDFLYQMHYNPMAQFFATTVFKFFYCILIQ